MLPLLYITITLTLIAIRLFLLGLNYKKYTKRQITDGEIIINIIFKSFVWLPLLPFQLGTFIANRNKDEAQK